MPRFPAPLDNRTATSFALCLLATWALSARTGRAQDRPTEADMFGAPPAQSEAPGPAGAASGTADQPAGDNPAASSAAERDEAIFGGDAAPAEPAPESAAGSTSTSRDDAVLGGTSTPMFTDAPAPSDPLSIGGQLYLRAQASGDTQLSIDDYVFSTPSLLDVYFDARPNDRVRGFVLGRMSYDPSIGSGSATPLTAADPVAGSESLSALFGRPSGDPRVVLDQLWLRFDIAHRLFVTAGKQHVRWGTARFWSPADFLHLRRRNPLDVFDARTGTTMLKLHFPIESEAWNFYGYLVTEGPNGAPQLEQIAAALRAELVFGQTELGLGMFARKDSKTKFAADLSSGIGDFDVYAELAVRDRGDIDAIRFDRGAAQPDFVMGESWQSPDEIGRINFQRYVDALYPVQNQSGYRPQLVAGLSYSRKYHDNDTFTVGAEYFYNPLGYDSPSAYPGLLLPRTNGLRDPATFFYLGKHYAALFFSMPAPFSLDLHTFTLSTLANLSDRSFISRLDYSLSLLTHLRFEAYAALHYGTPEGEFRLGFEPSGVLGDLVSQAPGALRSSLSRAPSLIDLGIGLRLAI